MTENELKAISPAKVLGEIAEVVPAGCRDKLIIIGSLAVGYHYADQMNGMAVRTKDADCLLSPRVAAVDAGIQIAQDLMNAGWQFKPIAPHNQPGTESTPEDNLPAVRLTPPGKSEWFIELLTVPADSHQRNQRWVRLATSHGHFGLCSFGFLSLNDLEPIPTDLGIRIARPEMMALASLLEHPIIKSNLMSTGFAGRMDIKRSNKDLGRVLAIARLAIGRDEDALLKWPALWKDALQNRFPDEWRELASRAGNGLRALLASEQDLEQALYTCAYGLLVSRPPTLEQLRIAGQRLVQDVILPLEVEAGRDE
ncbi:MAG: hypothetical protein PHI93_03140 [Kiritimatiellae bacterium]|nr:hypothetical protein [Kiritimatiellia bacterium]